MPKAEPDDPTPPKKGGFLSGRFATVPAPPPAGVSREEFDSFSRKLAERDQSVQSNQNRIIEHCNATSKSLAELRADIARIDADAAASVDSTSRRLEQMTHQLTELSAQLLSAEKRFKTFESELRKRREVERRREIAEINESDPTLKWLGKFSVATTIIAIIIAAYFIFQHSK